MSDRAGAIPRIVLDTNVCLDLFLFADPRCSHLLEALRRGAVRAVTRSDCHDEWLRVLHYPQLPIDDVIRPGVIARYEALIEHLPDAQSLAAADAPLPRCADADDQKFMELALASQARWLLSKDKELLKLDRWTRAEGLFPILLPQDWSLHRV